MASPLSRCPTNPGGPRWRIRSEIGRTNKLSDQIRHKQTMRPCRLGLAERDSQTLTAYRQGSDVSFSALRACCHPYSSPAGGTRSRQQRMRPALRVLSMLNARFAKSIGLISSIPPSPSRSPAWEIRRSDNRKHTSPHPRGWRR